jgi:hypothetical protein
MFRNWLPIVSLALLALAVGPSAAQQRGPVPSAAVGGGESVRVQVSVNFFVAGPDGESEQAVKARERARSSIYELASGECELLRSVIAGECRLEAVNVNIQRQRTRPQVEGFTANGSMTFRIIRK